MYKKAYCLATLFTLFTGLLVLYCTFYIPITGENPSFKRVPTYSEEVVQKRIGVHKDLWIAKEGGRVHYQMDCPNSTLYVQGTPQKRYHHFFEQASHLHAVQREEENENREPATLTSASVLFNYGAKIVELEDIFFTYGPYYAGKATHLHLNIMNMESICASGGITFARKDQLLATADRLIYTPSLKMLEFAAGKDQKVLFWDLIQESSLRADRLTMERDPDTNRDIIKGHGRVEWTFIQPEKAELLKLFKQ